MSTRKRVTSRKSLEDVIREVAFARDRIVAKEEEKSELEKIMEEEERVKARQLRLARLEKMHEETMRELERLRKERGEEKEKESKEEVKPTDLAVITKIAKDFKDMDTETIMKVSMLLSALHGSSSVNPALAWLPMLFKPSNPKEAEKMSDMIKAIAELQKVVGGNKSDEATKMMVDFIKSTVDERKKEAESMRAYYEDRLERLRALARKYKSESDEAKRQLMEERMNRLHEEIKRLRDELKEGGISKKSLVEIAKEYKELKDTMEELGFRPEKGGGGETWKYIRDMIEIGLKHGGAEALKSAIKERAGGASAPVRYMKCQKCGSERIPIVEGAKFVMCPDCGMLYTNTDEEPAFVKEIKEKQLKEELREVEQEVEETA